MKITIQIFLCFIWWFSFGYLHRVKCSYVPGLQNVPITVMMKETSQHLTTTRRGSPK